MHSNAPICTTIWQPSSSSAHVQAWVASITEQWEHCILHATRAMMVAHVDEYAVHVEQQLQGQQAEIAHLKVHTRRVFGLFFAQGSSKLSAAWAVNVLFVMWHALLPDAAGLKHLLMQRHIDNIAYNLQ